MDDVATAQQILDGRWQHAAAARRACQEASWGAFVNAHAPARPMLAGRRDHRTCVAAAERSLAGPWSREVTLVPLWACSTEDATSNEWVAVHGAAHAGEALGVREVGPFIGGEDASPRADAIWVCTARVWTAATVVESRSYAPDIELRLRLGRFGVLELDVVEVLAVERRASEARPRPTREVPMFASWFEPRVEVPAALAAEIAALCFTAEAVDEDDAS